MTPHTDSAALFFGKVDYYDLLFFYGLDHHMEETSQHDTTHLYFTSFSGTGITVYAKWSFGCDTSV